MIGVDSPTPLDLKFPLGPIPVRVSVLFWLFTALFGYMNAPAAGMLVVNILIWVACVFVSILGHELGHALAYRLFGSWAAISLHGFGGYAIAPDPPRAAWRRMLVSLAGPLAGFALFGVTLAVAFATAGAGLHFYAQHAIKFMLWINLFWSLFNLLPILPLDGGNICRELLATFRVRSADALAAGLGFVLALLLAVYGALLYAGLLPAAVADVIPTWLRPGTLMTIWFALFAVDNFQRMQLARRQRYYDPPDDDTDTPPWRR
jgi:stage IV sporulation protein FB